MTPDEVRALLACIRETDSMVRALRRAREVPAASMRMPCDAPARQR